MYEVVYYPKKCKRDCNRMDETVGASVVMRTSNAWFNWHKGCGCMKVLRHYRNVTVSKKVCPCCKQMVIKTKEVE